MQARNGTKYGGVEEAKEEEERGGGWGWVGGGVGGRRATEGAWQK